MNYGFYVSASAAAANIARQNVFANNLANVNTVGFRPDTIAVRHRAAARLEDNLFHLPSNDLLERLGAGVMPTPTRVSTSQGNIRQTGAALDVAVRGEGFLRVRAGLEESGGAGFLLTRDGRMTLGRDGTLVRATDGAAVLDDAGRAITLDPTTEVDIDEAGVIRQRGVAVATLGLVDVRDASLLSKRANASLALGPAYTANELTLGRGLIEQGAVEDAAVNPINAMMAVEQASRAVQSNLRMVSTIHSVMGNAINRLGRVS